MNQEQSLTQNTYLVAAFYLFNQIEACETLRVKLLNFCCDRVIFGTILLAKEGINGTVAGESDHIAALFQFLKSFEAFKSLTPSYSQSVNMPFQKMKVKLRKEVVTLGCELHAHTKVGEYIEPEQWNSLIERADVLLIDTRNHYEFKVGTFKGAISPETRSFRQFPGYVEQQLNPQQHKKVAMFCTGGIRCEKATALLLEQGFESVYHLKGGILNYLAQIPEEKSLWQGECFVFDERVTVKHGLVPGQYDMCNVCRHTLTEEEKTSHHYQKEVSCPHCYHGGLIPF